MFIPTGISKGHILNAIELYNEGKEHKFAQSTKYDLLHKGKRYPPKAILGIAAELVTGRVFTPYDFHAGVRSKCFRILKACGFDIVPKRVRDSDKWLREELEDTIAEYQRMLNNERKGRIFIKADVYKGLQAKYGRSWKAYERRMQNISYVYSLQGRDWVSGLKPLSHVGSAVIVILEELIAKSENRRLIKSAAFEDKVRRYVKKPPKGKPSGNAKPKKTIREVDHYERDHRVKAWVLSTAKGKCEMCEQSAPFKNDQGDLYLEAHHLVALSANGPDTVCNVVAVCPNCHRELHYGKKKKLLLESLYMRIDRLSARRLLASNVRSVG